MEEWAAGIQRGFVWSRYPDSPIFDTQAKAEAWLRDWLIDQSEPSRIGGLLTVRQLPTMGPL